LSIWKLEEEDTRPRKGKKTPEQELETAGEGTPGSQFPGIRTKAPRTKAHEDTSPQG